MSFSAWEQVPETLVRKSWFAGNSKIYEDLQCQSHNALMQKQIIEHVQIEIIDTILEVCSNHELVQHYLALDKVSMNKEFND